MICNKCKKKQGLFDRYCPECGTKLEHRKLTKEELTKIKKYLLTVIITICLLWFGYRTIQYLRSPQYQALNYFKAVANNDVDKIYTYLDSKESDFVNSSILSEKMEVIGDIKNYQVTCVRQYQNYVIVSIRYATSTETNLANIKLTKTNNFFQPYEVVSGKIVENVEFKIPKGATLEIDGTDMSSYKKTEDSYDIYTISSMIKGTYHIKVVINDIVVEDDVDVEENGIYTISNVELKEELSDSLIFKTKEELNYWYTSIVSKKTFDEIKNHYNVSSKNTLKSSYNNFKRTMNTNITSISVIDLEEKKVTYSSDGKLCITYLVDQELQTSEKTYDYSNYIKVEYDYVDGTYEIYNISKK